MHCVGRFWYFVCTWAGPWTLAGWCLSFNLIQFYIDSWVVHILSLEIDVFAKTYSLLYPASLAMARPSDPVAKLSASCHKSFCKRPIPKLINTPSNPTVTPKHILFQSSGHKSTAAMIRKPVMLSAPTCNGADRTQALSCLGLAMLIHGATPPITSNFPVGITAEPAAAVRGRNLKAQMDGFSSCAPPSSIFSVAFYEDECH